MEKINPIDNLSYFIEWGGKNWHSLVNSAITELNKTGIKDKKLLDIGTRYGKMSVFFSLLGAKVTGLDIHEEHIEKAKKEAEKWNVTDIDFLTYNGDLDIFPDEHFDIIFTKSVLVVIPDLEKYLKKLNSKLKPGGRIVFIENSKGNFFLHYMRKFKHRHWDYSYVNFFTQKQIKLINSIFNIDLFRKSYIPPIYLFAGTKKDSK